MSSGATQARLQIAEDVDRDMPVRQTDAAPIVAAVDGSSASTVAVETAVHLAAELDAPIVFVYVRRGPASYLGIPVYQRRLTAEMERGRRVLDEAFGVAAAAGVDAEGEILEGRPRRRITDFARIRNARFVVVGSRPPQGRAQRFPRRRSRGGSPSRRRAGSPPARSSREGRLT
jgi:nucleotide-binding universal stress UspA family protein